MKIRDKCALVTGAASGMGEAVARMLHQQGANLILLDRDEAKLQQVANELQAQTLLADICDINGLSPSFNAALEGKILDICVNCAGIAPAFKVVKKGEINFEAFRKTIDVNLIGTYNVVALACANMMGHTSRDDGVIINTASVAAFEGQIGQVAYSASKGGVMSMTLPLARELASSNIRVNTIAPGIIETPLFDGLTKEVTDRLEASVPFPKRLGKPAEFAKLVCHIVENGYINGETIRLDGALRMAPI